MTIDKILNRVFFLIKKDPFIIFPYLIFSLMVFLVGTFGDNLKITGRVGWLRLLSLALVVLFWVLDMLVNLITMELAGELDREQPVSLFSCLKACFSKVVPFFFASIFSNVLIFFFGFGLAQIFFYRKDLSLVLFLLGIVVANLILVLWPAALVAENSGPLGAFKYNFLKMKIDLMKFLIFGGLFLILQMMGFMISAQLASVSSIGPVLSFLVLGFMMAFFSIYKMVGYINWEKK